MASSARESSTATETTPLIQTPRPPTPPSSGRPQKSQRNVTFHPTVSTSGPPVGSANTGTSTARPGGAPLTQSQTHRPESSGQPMLSAINSRLRRRHSHGSSLAAGLPQVPLPKAGAQRTTKTAQKLKLLPNPDQDEEQDEESGRDVYSQFTRIKDPTARRDAARLGRDDRAKLPRVSAYCTANSYKLDDMMKYFRSRIRNRNAAPKLFDECIYTPYKYGKFVDPSLDAPTSIAQIGRRFSDSVVEVDNNHEDRVDDLMDAHTETAGTLTLDNGEISEPNHTAAEMEQPEEPRLDTLDFDTQVHTPEVFLFNYGTVVIWGMTLKEEQRFLREIAKFETEKLAKDDVQVENFNFYYTREYQARIYNDFISLREKRNYMTKLAISHALSQSVKTSLYEDLVDNTIESTKEIPAQIATTGKVNLSRKEINMQIGELFILRINIHLQGSVLDSPELMWAEPQLDPVYQAVRSYLEMDQRVSLLQERLDVIADLLAVLKDQLAHGYSEALEVIVIILIAMEILVAAVNIVVDLYAGVD